MSEAKQHHHHDHDDHDDECGPHLFQYAVLYTGCEKTPPKVLVEIKAVLAECEDAVRFKAIREVPEEFADKGDRIRVVVRNFCHPQH